MKARADVVTLVTSEDAERSARLLVDSLRAFGGPLADCAVWAFVPASTTGLGSELADAGVRVVPLDVPEELARYPFGAKVTACALAEEMIGVGGRVLIWMAPQCLVVAPPVLLDPAGDARAAFRTVHISNIGSRVSEPVDGFWKEIYARAGVGDPGFTVESIVDEVTLRPYFNTHLFSVGSSVGLSRRWLEVFSEAVRDDAFQSGACSDERHRIFLHSALLSALAVGMMPRERIRMLPLEYSYPLEFHARLPEHKRVADLGDLVCPVYEGAYSHPATLGGIGVRNPLGAWLAERAG